MRLSYNSQKVGSLWRNFKNNLFLSHLGRSYTFQQNVFCFKNNFALKLNLYIQKVTLIYPCVVSHFSSVWLFAILWTVAHQAPLYMKSSRQEYWNGLPSPSSGNLPKPGSPAPRPMFFKISSTGYKTSSREEHN